MVQAFINITKHINQVINIVKAKYNLKDKSEAINLIAKKYEAEILEPGYKIEFIKKIKSTSKENRIKVKDFKNHFDIEE